MKKTKQYTPKQRASYHAKRVNSPLATERQKLYSANWISGYNDEHAQANLVAAEKELAHRRLLIKKTEQLTGKKDRSVRLEKATVNAVFTGYIRGLRARLSN